MRFTMTSVIPSTSIILETYLGDRHILVDRLIEHVSEILKIYLKLHDGYHEC